MKTIDKIIKKLYLRRTGFKLPLYIWFGKYCLSFYAQDLDWKSMRIKIMKHEDCETKIIKVIKKGIY